MKAKRYNKLGKALDWFYLYYLGWVMILTSPIWLPIYLARQINKWKHNVNM